MTNTNSSQLMKWNSPVPYLFGGLAFILGLIAIALMILACSYLYSKKHGDDGSLDTGKKTATMDDMVAVDNVPKVVVIMAGDDMPTYLAMPKNNLSSSSADLVSPHPRPTEASDDDTRGDDARV